MQTFIAHFASQARAYQHQKMRATTGAEKVWCAHMVAYSMQAARDARAAIA